MCAWIACLGGGSILCWLAYWVLLSSSSPRPILCDEEALLSSIRRQLLFSLSLSFEPNPHSLMRRHHSSQGMRRRIIRDCSDFNNFPENRSIAAQHQWMWTLFGKKERKRSRARTSSSSGAVVVDERTHHRSLSAGELWSTSHLLASIPSPPLHTPSSAELSQDEEGKGEPPIPLEIAVPQERLDESLVKRSQQRLLDYHRQPFVEEDSTIRDEEEDILRQCDEQQQDQTMEDASSTSHTSLVHLQQPSWPPQQQDDCCCSTFYADDTIHDSTWGMTTTTLRDLQHYNTPTSARPRSRLVSWATPSTVATTGSQSPPERTTHNIAR